MNKRERLEKAIGGEQTDRTPVALWRHFPGDDQRAADFAAATIDWQRRFDWDFVKVTPASSFCLTDYGVQDKWVGSLEGTREYTRQVVNKSLDWTELRPLDPTRGALGRQTEALKQIQQELGSETPVIQTIFSPLVQARHITDEAILLKHMRTTPDRLKSGLNAITESTTRFIDAIRRTGIAGIYYAVQMGSFATLSAQEYAEFGRPYDLQILKAIPKDWWFNVLHLHGDAPIFEQFVDYPVQALNWHDRETEPDLANGKRKFKGAVCGGLGRWDAVHNGTPAEVREQARTAFEQTEGRRFILSTGCVTMITTPLSNLRAVREFAETKR